MNSETPSVDARFPQSPPTGSAIVASSPTIIDLRKPGDLALVHRSVINGWDVPQDIRTQICDQLTPAMDFYDQRWKQGHQRSAMHLVKLCKLALLMDVSDRVDAGERKSLHPIGRKRGPEGKRQPRRVGGSALERKKDLAAIHRQRMEGLIQRMSPSVKNNGQEANRDTNN